MLTNSHGKIYFVIIKEPINALTIAGGFGTRMGIEIPKGLIEIAKDRTIIGRMFFELQGISDIEDQAIVTNARFFPIYKKWLSSQKLNHEIRLLNNGVRNPEGRLGAIGDMAFALNRLGWWDRGDLLVLPSDTLYQFCLRDFLEFSRKKNGLSIVINRLNKERIANRLGCISFRDDRVEDFEEKPNVPKSDWAIVPFYYYPKKLISKIKKYVDESGGDRKKLDAPSTIIYWLMKQNIPVYVYKTEALTLDVGKPVDVSLAQANHHCFIRQK